MNLITLLHKNDLISEDNVEELQQKIQENPDNKEGIIKDAGVSGEDLMKAKSDYYGVPIWKVNPQEIPQELSDIFPEKQSNNTRCYHLITKMVA